MEDYLRHWGGRLRVAWLWVFQPLVLGLLLAAVLVVQPALHLIQSVLLALADEQVYAEMAEADGWRRQMDGSVRKLLGFVPVERIAGIGDEPADEAEQEMLAKLTACRERLADSISSEMTGISETVVGKVPLYITSPEKPELDFRLNMDAVTPVMADCGGDVSRNALGFLVHRASRLTTEELAARLREPDTLARLRDPEQVPAVLAEVADELDAQRQEWLASAGKAGTAMEAGETVARWRGIMKDEDETTEAPPSQVWDESLDQLNGVHTRYTERLRALEPAGVAAADDPADYVLSQLEEGLTEESALLVERQAKPYLQSLVTTTADGKIELTELSLTVRSTLAPIRSSYRSFAYTCEVTQRAIWLLLALMAITAWQMRKLVTWLLAVCLGCAMLTWLYGAAAAQTLRMILDLVYPAALDWSFSQRLFEVSGTAAAVWAGRWLAVAVALLLGTLLLRLILTLAARALRGRPSEPYYEHLTDPEHRLSLADPLLLPLAAFEATITRRGTTATPAEATRRRRVLGMLAVDYLLSGLVMYLLVLGLELAAGLVSQLLEDIPILGDWIDPAVSGQAAGWATGVGLILVLATWWALRDTLVIYLPRAFRWLDPGRWVGLDRRMADPTRKWPGFRPWLARLAVIAAIVGLTVVIPLSGGVLVALAIAWLIEAAVLILRARHASIADRLGHVTVVLATPPDDGL